MMWCGFICMPFSLCGFCGDTQIVVVVGWGGGDWGGYPALDRRCFLRLLSARGWGIGEEITPLFYLYMLICGMMMMTPLIGICEQRHNTPLPFSSLPL